MSPFALALIDTRSRMKSSHILQNALENCRKLLAFLNYWLSSARELAVCEGAMSNGLAGREIFSKEVSKFANSS